MATQTSGFIERHGLWTDEQRRQALELKRRLEQERLQFVRMAWADPHGAARAKAVTLPAFLPALTNGYNINVATTTLDSANARTFSSFTRGGGMGLDEMTGSPNLTIVPDPSTFRVLPWAPGVGWILCDEYFNTGVPFHFSPRQLLRKQLRRLQERGLGCVVGLEIEWYLLRVAEDGLGDEHIGGPGVRGRPIKTAPPEPGYSYHSEIQSRPDAAGIERAGGGVREDRSAAAIGGERVGTGSGRMHLCAARRAQRGRQPAAVSHRDAADLPPHGLFRELHVPSRIEGSTTRAAGTCTNP